MPQLQVTLLKNDKSIKENAIQNKKKDEAYTVVLEVVSLTMLRHKSQHRVAEAIASALVLCFASRRKP